MKHIPRALAYLGGELDALREQNRLRERRKPLLGVSFCSNDYLGLAATPAPAVAAGAGASRLVDGEHEAHGALERTLADWLRTPSTLLFTSGYAANVGVLSALIRRDDFVVSDELNHASIIDGLRLARAHTAIVPHLDTTAVAQSLARREGRRAWVVTESYFSMDADSPDIALLREICDEHAAGLIVDEAHALGVFGPEGRGACAAAGVVADVLVGTLGKAFGAAGAFVAGSEVLVDWLWNRARSHVFATAMSPAIACAALTNVQRAQGDPSLRIRAIQHAARFRDALRASQADVRGIGPIVPWVLGTESAALFAADELRRKGIHVVAIRPPTVPENTSRLRFTFTARHTDEDVTRAITASRAVLECLPR